MGDEISEVQPDFCTDEVGSSPATLDGPTDSDRVEELIQQIEWWYQEAKLLDKKHRESTVEVVQLKNLLQETRCSLRSKLDDSNEKIVALTIENSCLQRQNSTLRREELLKEREMFQLSLHPDHHKINKLQETVERLTAEKITLQEQYEDLNTKLQTVRSDKTSEHKLYQKLTEIKLENAKLNKQNKELNLDFQEITERTTQVKKQDRQLKLQLQEAMEKNAENDKYEKRQDSSRFVKRAQSLTSSPPASVNTSYECTACMKKNEELDALKTQLVELEKDHEQTKHENMKMTAQIDFLQSEQSNGKLTEESSIKISGSEVLDDSAACVKIPTIKKSCLNMYKYRMQLPPPRYHYQLRVYQMWLYIEACI